jgi:Transposase DDE domain
VYVNPDTQQFWAIDYRIYNPSSDRKSKLEHVRDMLNSAVSEKSLPFATVLMDSWYSSRELMLQIASLGKIYYTVAKPNRLIAEQAGQHAYQRLDTLDWTEEELQTGKTIRLNDFPNGHKGQLFRVTALPGKTEFVVTNDVSQHDVHTIRKTCKVRWKVEEFHREMKQLTGIERCQCRKESIQRNHIGCAMLVWARLKTLAYQTGRSVYDLWKSQFDPMVSALFHSPTLPFA